MITWNELKRLSYEEFKNISKDISYEELEKLELISKKYKEGGFKNSSLEELREIELVLWDIRWHTKSWVIRKISERVLDKVLKIIEEYERDKERLSV